MRFDASAALAAAAVIALAACGNGRTQQAEAASPPATQVAENTAAPAADAASSTAELPANAPTVEVYKSPTCGCCNNWVAHMRQNGFRVVTHDTADVAPVKDAAHVPMAARSCHTGLVGGYAIEGHVPADLVQRLLREHPSDVAGLAVPGMVSGSPGMDGPDPQHYDVIAFTKDGKTRVYASR